MSTFRRPGARRARVPILAGMATVAVLVTPLAVSGAQASGASRPTYQNPAAPVAARVHDLLGRMTLTEKVGQLDQISVTSMQGNCGTAGLAPLNPTCMRQVLTTDATGAILSGGGAAPARNTPEAWAQMVDDIQHYAITHSRLRIPVIYGEDSVHGDNNLLGATKFPQEIGLGATWDPTLAARVAASTHRTMAATGVSWDFAPVMDVSRDDRWGRYYEQFAEDPVLDGTLGASEVEGLQAPRHDAMPLAATVKHFAGYSQPFNGHDRTDSLLPLNYLQDQILPAYKQAIEAGAMTVMSCSCAVNDVPVTASHYLLTDVLRGQYHFTGVVDTDWADVSNLMTAYHIAADYPHAIADAINAGVDMVMEPYNAQSFVQATLGAVGQHLLSVSRIDESVSRILTLKFRLGLFDHPYVDPSKADGIALGADTALARQAGDESITLLRDQNNVLPLTSSDSHIVVTGPNADSIPNQDGGWTIGWQGIPSGITDTGVTVVDGIRAAAPRGTTVDYEPDAGRAVAATRQADVAVVVVGDTPAAEGLADQPNPELSVDQRQLVSRLRTTGKPVVVVVVADRPLVLGSAATTDGLLMAYLPGSQGGNSVADVLFGTVNPSGRLAVSWPAALGNEPEFYLQYPGTNSGTDSNYSPLYPFGYGLSYTTFDTRSLAVGSATVSGSGTVSVRVTVANTGERAGDDVVPVYVSQPVSPALVPAKRLVAFTRVSLAAGQSRTVSLTFPASRLAVSTGDVNGGPQRVEPGQYVLTTGQLSATTPSATFEIG